MSDDRELARAIDAWIADGPSQMPDRILYTVADRIDRQRQRPAWRLRWRSPDMPMLLRVATGVAVVVLVVFAGWTFLPGRDGGVGGPGPTPTPATTPTPTPTPSPSPTPVPSIACEDDIPGCAGPLAAGEHDSRQFVPALRFTVPDGWTNVVDAKNVYKLDPIVNPGSYLIVWSEARIAEECTSAPKPGLGHSPQDFVEYLVAHPDIEATSPVPIVRGGYQGQAIDVWIRAGWVNPCPAANGLPFILAGTDDPYWYGIAPTGRMHVELLDVAGNTVVFQVYGSQDETAFASDIAPAQAIIESVVIAAP